MSSKVALILAVLILVASGALVPAKAQGEIGDNMMSFTDTVYGISGLVPSNWQKAGPGLYARKATPQDPTLLVEQSAAISMDQLKGLLSTQLGLKALPASSASQKTESFSWELYSVPKVSAPAGTLDAEIAVSEANRKSYVIMLLAVPDEVKSLRDGVFLPAVKALAPLAAPAAPELDPDEQEVIFSSGNDTIYGTLLLPKASGKAPAALLLSGSGPTDRNGNNRLLPNPVDTHKIMARILASQGVASLRYDKLGTGKTGLGSYASHLSDLDFELYVNEARDALKYLTSRPEIDPTRVMILGHSEGGLIAMLAAKAEPDRVKALALVSPISKPYLQTIHDQYQAQLTAAVKVGTMPQAQANKVMSAIDKTNESLLSTGTVPADIPPELKQIYNPSTTNFLAQVGKYDPGKVAESLPKSLPALIVCGEKDVQVSCSDVQYLVDGFKRTANDHVSVVQLADTNHVLRVVQGGDPADYSDISRPFSEQMKQALISFVKANLLAAG